MSLHTGIEPSKEIDVLELNLRSKKYVDDKLALKVDKAGDTITGPLSMDDGKIWDLSSGTLDTNAVNKKYVDDVGNLKLAKTGGTLSGELSMDDNKITDLATPTENSDAATKKYVDDNSGSQITVKDSGYTTRYLSARRVLVDGNRMLTEVDNLTNATISHPQIIHMRLGFNGNAMGFAFSNGKIAIIWGGFNELNGSVLKASLLVSASSSRTFSKIKLMHSDDASGIFFH